MIKIIPAPHRFEEEEGGVRPPPPMLGRGRSGLPHPRGWGRDPPPACLKTEGVPIHSFIFGRPGEGADHPIKKKIAIHIDFVVSGAPQNRDIAGMRHTGHTLFLDGRAVARHLLRNAGHRGGHCAQCPPHQNEFLGTELSPGNKMRRALALSTHGGATLTCLPAR